jgi:hypothetical protein
MTVDHYDRMPGRATLLVRAMDRILGTHKTVYRHEIRPALTKGATAMNRILKAKATQPA